MQKLGLPGEACAQFQHQAGVIQLHAIPKDNDGDSDSSSQNDERGRSQKDVGGVRRTWEESEGRGRSQKGVGGVSDVGGVSKTPLIQRYKNDEGGRSQDDASCFFKRL